MLNASKTFELNVLIGGKPITEYAHEDGPSFIEGRKGSEFEVEFKNKTNKQVLVVPSVDGKSIFDGKPATPESRGYVIRAWGSIRIPGWTLDNAAVAKFTFEDKDKSYSAAVTQEGEAVVSGVIGVMVYSEVEKPKPVTLQHVHHHYPRPNPFPQPGVFPRGPYDWPYNGPTWSSTCAVGSSDTVTLSSSNSMSKGITRGATAQSTSHENTSSVSDSTPDASFDLGAGFGQKADFRTTTVEFERGPVLDTFQLYYDSRKNLEKRGFVMVRKEQRYLNDLPQAFVGTGCTPPPGWQG